MSIPPAYTYTSERLLREVYERASSQRRGSLKDANLIVPTPFGVSLNLSLDLKFSHPENVYRLAKFADSVLKTVPFSAPLGTVHPDRTS